jgi:hypothetical protein
MTKKIEPKQRGWWKFDRYEIADGYIRPAAGAHLETYDPWEQHRKSGIDSSIRPPYEALLELLQVLGVDYTRHRWDVAEQAPAPGGRVYYRRRAGIAYGPFREGRFSFETTIDSEIQMWREVEGTSPAVARRGEAILDWCHRYGLLGILPHISLSANLYPRRVRRDRWETTSYRRANSRWISIEISHQSHRSDHNMSDDLGANVLICGEQQFPDAAPEIRELDIEDSWGCFFPAVPKRNRTRYQYPIPLSDDFWRNYAEPVPTFIRYALTLQQAVEPLSAKSQLTQVIPAEDALAFANALLSPVSREVVLGADNRLEHSWVYPSLISSLAAMALEDLALGAMIRSCAGCNKPFVTSAYQSLYCSQNCAWRDRKRKARAMKVTERVKPDGKTTRK